MKTKIIKTSFEGLLLLEIDYFQDTRGFFIEPWNRRDFHEAGFDEEFVQEGHSRSKKDVLRGLHYQDLTAPMGKLVRCTVGEVFEVAVDLRLSSKTFGKWYSTKLSARNKMLLYVPVGFALGFLTLSPYAEMQYKQTGYYTPSAEHTLLWNDAQIGVKWPVLSPPILSDRDTKGTSLQVYLQNPAFL
ncbi:MAG: dTDP-4-dehydrorhamnose 3,5-epimerase [Microgenomates group bacterium]